MPGRFPTGAIRMRIPRHFFPFKSYVWFYATLRVMTDLINMSHFAALPLPPKIGRRLLTTKNSDRATDLAERIDGGGGR